MRRYMKHIVPSFLFIIAFTRGAHCQIGCASEYRVFYDTNVFKNYENLADVVHSPNWSIFYDLNGDKNQVRFSYDGEYTLFHTYQERHFHWHTLGIAGRWNPEREGFSLGYSINASQRFNKISYSYYDNRSVFSALFFSHEHSRAGILGGGVSVRLQDFLNLPQFSSFESVLFLHYSLFLKTKTTVIARIEMGYKEYLHDISEVGEIDTALFTDDHGQGQGNGQGYGYGKDKGKKSLKALADDASSSLPGAPTSASVNASLEGRESLQGNASIRLAQSVFSWMGIAFEGSVKRRFLGQSRTLYGQDSGYTTDDPLYDDPYSYEGEKWMCEWTQWVWGWMLKASYSWQDKRYDAFYQQEEEGESLLRRDRQQRFGVILGKQYKPIWRIIGLTFYFDYAYVKNESNDPYFHYQNHTASLALGFEL